MTATVPPAEAATPTAADGPAADAPRGPDGEARAAAFTAELVERNRGVVDAATQSALADATILVAGCGSIGGAVVEPLVRLGARRFLLADPGRYELNNLNRQNATVGDLGGNKAVVAAQRILSINPHASVQVHQSGISEEVSAVLVGKADVIVDGVDVTTRAGLDAKIVLHEQACRQQRPLVTGWDMAGAQYVRVYDYRRIRAPFDGHLVRSDLQRLSMWQILQRLVPLRFVPIEMVRLVRDHVDDDAFQFPQLVQAADVFGALASHIVGELVGGRRVRPHTYVDVHDAVRPARRRWQVRGARSLALLSALARLRRAQGGLAPSPSRIPTQQSSAPSGAERS